MIKQINNYKYYLAYSFLLYAYYSIIFLENLNFYFFLDFISLKNNLKFP